MEQTYITVRRNCTLFMAAGASLEKELYVLDWHLFVRSEAKLESLLELTTMNCSGRTYVFIY